MCTIAETMVTATIMTPDRVSSRNDHWTSTPPAAIQVAKGTICACSCVRISRNSGMPSNADRTIAPQVTISAPRSPITRPKKPAMKAASSGRKTTATAKCSAPHHPDVLDLDRAAVAEIDDQDREADRRLGRRHGQHEHREDLADEIVEDNREGDEVDVDREQHQLDRHHDDDDVLAIEKDAEDPEREQDRGDGQVMGQADRHWVSLRPHRRSAPSPPQRLPRGCAPIAPRSTDSAPRRATARSTRSRRSSRPGG